MQPKEYIMLTRVVSVTYKSEPKKKVFSKIFLRCTYDHSSMWKGNACSYTALATGKCSRSIYMPPLVVYKTQYLNDTWTINRPRDATYAVTISRWMFNVIFEQWFQNSLIPRFIYNKKPAIIFWWSWVSFDIWNSKKSHWKGNHYHYYLFPSCSKCMHDAFR